MADKIIDFRSFTEEDVTQLFAIYSDKEAMKYRGSKPMKSLQDADDFVQNQCLVNGAIKTIRKEVVINTDSKLIGSVMLRYNSSKPFICEIGYSIGRAFWQQGFGKEIVKLLVNELKSDSTIQEVNAWSHKENIGSVKILEALGFECKRIEEGKFKLYVLNI